MKNVRLENGIISEIIDGELPQFHPDVAAQFFQSSDDVREGEVFDHANKTSSPFVPAAEQIIARYTSAVQHHLDAFARSRGYDSILSATTYTTSAVPKFAAEGGCAVEARDATWAKCYDVLTAVQSGLRPMPTIAELFAELPVLVWP